MLEMGLGSSVFAGGFPSASVPQAAPASPQGPRTVGQQAFGITSGPGDGGPPLPGLGTTALGALALVGLAVLWWSLPK